MGECLQDKTLLDRARKLRNASTPFEARLWHCLSGSKLNGHKFRRQYVVDHCIVDFFCPAKRLIVEIDGDTHNAESDNSRDRHHAAQGLSTIRFSNADVGRNLEGVLSALLNRLESLPDRWTGKALPHPLAPSPEGEGK